jgi:hypothetical protein
LVKRDVLGLTELPAAKDASTISGNVYRQMRMRFDRIGIIFMSDFELRFLGQIIGSV